MSRFLILLAPLSLAACQTSTTPQVEVDPVAANATYSELRTQPEIATTDLPSDGSANYEGYITVLEYSDSSDAIGALSAVVNFANGTYTMSADSWIEVGILEDEVITGSLSGSGTIVESTLDGLSEIDGTMSGQVGTVDVDVELTGTFTGNSAGTPTGLRGGADGGTHSIEFGLTN